MSIATTSGLDTAARLDPDARTRVSRARDAFLDGSWTPEDRTIAVRSDILQSWKRSTEFGIAPAGGPPRATNEVRSPGQLGDAAQPVLDKLTEQSEHLGITAFVVDRFGTQVLPTAGDITYLEVSERRGAVPGGSFSEPSAGTNGAGLSMLRLEPFLVVGHEHFQEIATRVVSFGVPLRDALHRTQGHLVICATVDQAHPIMIPHALGVASAITERLVAATDRRDRALFGEFLRHSATPSTPVVVFNDRFCSLNTAAQQMLVRPQDVDLLREGARSAVAARRDSFSLELGVETYLVRCHALDETGGAGIIASFTRVRATTAPLPSPSFGLPTETTPASTPLGRARVQGIRAVIRGELGSGRSHLALATGPLREINGSDASADPAAWQTRLRLLLGSDDVLIRDIDRLPADSRRVAIEVVRESSRWCVATASDAAVDLDGVFPVEVECLPLRARKDELPGLVLAILAEVGANHVRLSQDAKSVLARYDWPGNVTELRKTLLNALTLQIGGTITLEHLPRAITAGGRRGAGRAIDQMERELIFEALKNAGWRRDAAADALGLSRSTMYRKLRQFPFEVPSSRT